MEKFHDWGDVYDVFSDTDIITLVMMHWIQGATPGLRFYREAFGRNKREAEKTFKTFLSVPTRVSMYVKEQLHVSSPTNVNPFELFLSSCSNGLFPTVPPRLGSAGSQHPILERV